MMNAANAEPDRTDWPFALVCAECSYISDDQESAVAVYVHPGYVIVQWTCPECQWDNEDELANEDLRYDD